MTQDEKWKMMYREYEKFIKDNDRCPSKHHLEERKMHTWWKHNRKVMNAGTMKPARLKEFKKLLALAESHRHINQFF